MMEGIVLPAGLYVVFYSFANSDEIMTRTPSMGSSVNMRTSLCLNSWEGANMMCDQSMIIVKSPCN